MKKLIYNLEFPDWCPSITLHDYKFMRSDDYCDQILRLSHGVSVISEFNISANAGQHAITAYVELPEHESKAILEWMDDDTTALGDILLLLSIFTGRNVFAINDDDDDIGVIVADPRIYQWGGSLRTSIPYKAHPIADPEDGFEYKCDIGLEEELNRIYVLIRTNEWKRKYGHGYFLFLANQAFRRQSLESAFIQCWTIWEHLFTVHNKHRLSDDKIEKLPAAGKIAFILTEYALKDEIDKDSKDRITVLATIRNRLIHFGKFPTNDSAHDDAVLFIRLTEFVIAKTLDLFPSNVFNTTEKLEEFLSKQSNR